MTRPASRGQTWERAQAGLLLAVVAAATVAGFMVAGADPAADADLTRLLRAMAAIKMLMAACAVAAVVWRLGVAATPAWFAAYAVACAAMAAGPGLIWGMAHIWAGAALTHLGLLATLFLLWRDRQVAATLATAVARRRDQIKGF